MKNNKMFNHIETTSSTFFNINVLCNKIYYEIFKNNCISELKKRKKTKPEYHYFELDYFMSFINRLSKIQTYYDMNEQLFVSTDNKNIFNSIYNKSSICYNALNRFSILCKIKYTKKYECNTDLCMNDLSEHKTCQIIKLVEDERVYAFWGKDLYNLIKKNPCVTKF